MTDYSLWEVIKNGNKVLTKIVGTIEQPYEPATVEEKLDRKNEIKARGTLLMALPNKYQLKFHSYQDAKLLMEAIKKRYGGNKESKKVQRTLLKQQYENFAASSSETLDQTFDRLQKLIRSSSTSQNLQNVAFVSSNSTNSTNKADNTAYGVSIAHTQGNTVNPTSVDNLSDAVICAFLASQPNSSQLAREDLEKIDPDDLEEMDLQWEMAMLTIRARRFIKRIGRNLDINGQKNGFDRSKVECFNCYKNENFARECKAPKNQENRKRDVGIKNKQFGGENGYDQEQIQALVDKQKVFITEESIRRDLKFDDAEVEGMDKHKKIYVMSSHTKKIFANMRRQRQGFPGNVTPLFKTMMVTAQEEKIKPKRKQRQAAEVHSPSSEIHVEESIPTPSNDPLPSEKANIAQAKEIAKLKKRVKKLEKRRKSRPAVLRRLKKVGSSKQVESVTPPKWVAAEYDVSGVLLHRSIAQDMRTTSKRVV
uniref:Uncharacterized protein n=1 Tax=Tanacetum cinerariifolium TaxID=118510 RepID=A0A6L2N7T0_TANCI|nr:hypothetical protein [Tanacetum cinerariifolium]